MAMTRATVEQLAVEFGLDIGAVYHARRFPGWPPGTNLDESRRALGLLERRIGAYNLRRVVDCWSEDLIEGIDV